MLLEKKACSLSVVSQNPKNDIKKPVNHAINRVYRLFTRKFKMQLVSEKTSKKYILLAKMQLVKKYCKVYNFKALEHFSD